MGVFTRFEWRILFLVIAVQIVNMTDGMMVLPLGPEFVLSLGIPTENIGYIGSAYVGAACVSGLLGSLMLDRFDRRKALGVAMMGLFAGTFLGGLATDFHMLLISRVVAGFFGGPASAISLAIVGDCIPVSRRGRAMGLVSAAFSIASILGVPAGLQLAILGGWPLPFFVVGGLGLIVGGCVYLLLPPQRSHMGDSGLFNGLRALADLGKIAKRRINALAIVAQATNMISGSLLIPILATYCTFILGYPREKLGLLWMAGGAMGFLGSAVAGRYVDRHGPVRPIAIISCVTAIQLWVMFVAYRPGWPLIPMFGLYVLLNMARSVTVASVISKVPPTAERGRFMSLVSTAQYAANTAGAMTSSMVLSEGPGGSLVHIDRLVYLAIATNFTVPVLIGLLERRIPDSREQAHPPPLPIAAGGER